MIIEPGVVKSAAGAMADAIGRFQALQEALDAGYGCDAAQHNAAIKKMYKARNKYIRLALADGGQSNER